MKVTCDREQLLAAFQTAAAVAPARSPKPILQNVKIEVTKKLGDHRWPPIWRSACGSVVSGIDVQAAGAALLAGRPDSARSCGRCSDEQLRIETDARARWSAASGANFACRRENPKNFRRCAEFSRSESITSLPARLLQRVDSPHAVRHRQRKQPLRLGRRAAGNDRRQDHRPWAPTAAGWPRWRCRPKASAAINTRRRDDDRAHAGHATDRAGAVRAGCRDADRRPGERSAGENAAGDDLFAAGRRAGFPSWRDVFPQRTGRRTRSSSPSVRCHSAVRQAAIVTSDEKPRRRFHLRRRQLVLSGRAAEVGQSHVELPIGYNGPEISITLDPRYMNDFLKVLDPEKTFTLELKDAESAAVCTTDDGYGYVIMPLARDH